MKKTLIIGGVAGGASCAARLRRLDEERQIILIERGPYISYANCGLPYHVGGVIPSRDALLVTTREMLESRFRVDVRTRHEALSIDREGKTVTIRNLETGETYQESYDELVLSTGSSPLRPPIPGINSEKIRTLWTVPDADEIRKLVAHAHGGRAAVIGGGFIGLEIAENLVHAGLQVSVIEAAPQVLAPLDPEMAKLVEEELISKGINLILNDPVQSFEEHDTDAGKTVTVRTKGSREIDADLVILSIGIRPNTSLAKDAGLTLNDRGFVIVSDDMRTSDPDIFAVGDIVETREIVTGGRGTFQLAGPANKQGRIAAEAIAGNREYATYPGSQGTSIAKIFDLSAAMTGRNEKLLLRDGLVKGKDYDVVYVTQNQHAGYYPGAVPMTIKVIYAAGGKCILGAQIVGMDGVDKRIDTLSAAIRLHAKATDLADLEFAYAPPFSSAKDPVNMAGFMIRNTLQGLVRYADWDSLEKEKDLQILDVREDAERLAFRIPGAIAIPLGELRDHLDRLDPEKPTIVFCAIGVRAYNASRILMQHGMKSVRIYPGGTRFYVSTHYKDYETFGADCGSRTETPQNSPVSDEPCGKAKKVRIDCNGMQCPGPLMRVYSEMKAMKNGDLLEVTASDPGFTRDIVAWCRQTGNTLLSDEKRGTEYVACLRKGKSSKQEIEKNDSRKDAGTGTEQRPKGETLVVFSGDMDRVMASLIIANGAAAMGKPVTMFFTFWGLSALRKKNPAPVKKDFTEKMFGAMLPKGIDRLPLSKMHMFGIGKVMMTGVMKKKNVDSVESLLKKAIASGVRIVACSMSMDVMGIKKEELIDGVEIGGVGTYLGASSEADGNLFV